MDFSCQTNTLGGSTLIYLVGLLELPGSGHLLGEGREMVQIPGKGEEVKVCSWHSEHLNPGREDCDPRKMKRAGLTHYLHRVLL